MKPLVERLAKEYAGKVDFRTYTDSGDPVGDALAQRFDIQYVPSFLFVNADGSVSGSPTIGGIDEATIRQKLSVLK
jgi:thiol-disulfide isomerase/thioredoxin